MSNHQYKIECDGVAKRFGNSVAVSNITFSIGIGTILVLLGPSGCGKTTTLRLIAGFETPDSGTIKMSGNPIASANVFVPPERRRIGMVFQDYALFPHLNVRRNIEFGISKTYDRKARSDETMNLLDIHDISEKMPHELSGGQQQRVALARALAPRPEIILMDEPFSNLDTPLRARVRTEIRTILKDTGTSAIFVTHDQDEAFALADEIGVMLSGTIAQIGSPRNIYQEPFSIDVATSMGDANILDGVANGNHIQSEIGNLPAKTKRHGNVQICLRPETVNINSAKNEHANGTVIESEFYGHFQIVKTMLTSGKVIRAKIGSNLDFPVGSHVEITTEAPVTVFPPTE